MKTWWPKRKALALVAILSAALTGSMGVALGETGWYVLGGLVYILVALLAAFAPAAITVLVILGQILVGSMVVGSGEAPPLLLLLPMVGTVVFTAELLAAVAAMDAPFPKDPGDVLPRSFTSALLGGAVFGGVLYLARLPGPGGLLAVALASAACVGLALFLAGHFQGSGERGSRLPGPDR